MGSGSTAGVCAPLVRVFPPARVAPLTGFPLRSVLWFQGEADAAAEAKTANYYECRLLGLIPAWQAALGNASAPFAIVNLGAVNDTGDNFGAIRLAQVRETKGGEGCRRSGDNEQRGGSRPTCVAAFLRAPLPRCPQESVLLGAPESRMAMAYDLGDPTQVRRPQGGDTEDGEGGDKVRRPSARCKPSRPPFATSSSSPSASSERHHRLRALPQQD